MKYKVGDKVRIKSEKELRNDNRIVNIQIKYAGLTATILTTDIRDDGSDDGYKIDLDDKEWWWFEDSFEDSYNPEKSILSEEMIKDIADVVKKHNLGVSISENEGKLVIEPLKVEEEEDLPIDTPVMVADKIDDWRFRYYAKEKRCFMFALKSHETSDINKWNYIIPFDKFNPNNIEESLKYNIVK